MNYHLYFLGTGTSDGVPVINCRCSVCSSKNLRDKRLRSSVLLEISCLPKNIQILIDTSLDFRTQMLRLQKKYPKKIFSPDFILYTHSHADHLLGLAELRPLSEHRAIDLFADPFCSKEIQIKFDYLFSSSIQKGGGIPQVNLHTVHTDELLSFNGLSCIPLPVKHGKLDIYGWRIGNFAYITDTNFIPEETFKKLKGVNYLVLNALRPSVHPTHFSIEEAVKAVNKIGAKKAYLTHICHALSHRDYQKLVNQLNDKIGNRCCQISPAYDGLEIFWEDENKFYSDAMEISR